jgi:hypothetical protein
MVERISENATSIQMGFAPCLNRARHNIAPKPASCYRPIDFVIIQQPLTDNKKIVIAVRPTGTARAAAEQDDGAWMQAFREAGYRLRESGVLNGLLSHGSYVSARVCFDNTHQAVLSAASSARRAAFATALRGPVLTLDMPGRHAHGPRCSPV